MDDKTDREKVIEILFYDENIYDGYFYKRRMMKRKLESTPPYDTLKIINIEYYYDDLDLDDSAEANDGQDDKELIISIKTDAFVPEFMMFFEIYKQYPSPFVRLYPLSFMEELFSAQYKDLRNKINNDNLNNLVYLVPFCYSKHYRTQKIEKQCINILCYINIIDSVMNARAPINSHRFVTLEMEQEDGMISQTHIKSLTAFIMEYTENIQNGNIYIEHLEMTDFPHALREIMNKQCFNLH